MWWGDRSESWHHPLLDVPQDHVLPPGFHVICDKVDHTLYDHAVRCRVEWLAVSSLCAPWPLGPRVLLTE